MKKLYKRITYIIIVILMVGGMSIKFTQSNQVEPKCAPAPSQGGIVSLCYHYVREKTLWSTLLEGATNSNEIKKYTVYTNEFKQQIDTLIEQGAYFATLEEVIQFRETGVYPDKCVWICFDDGDESVYKEAYSYLKEKQIPFTMFIIAGQVGNDNFHNLKLSTWEELREMRDSGLVSFGAHTYDMHYLRDEKAIFLHEDMYNEFYRDIKKSKKVIEDNLGIEITSMAYPYGHANAEISELVQKAGFESAFILAPYILDNSNTLYQLNRYLVDTDNFDQIFVNW